LADIAKGTTSTLAIIPWHSMAPNLRFDRYEHKLWILCQPLEDTPTKCNAKLLESGQYIGGVITTEGIPMMVVEWNGEMYGLSDGDKGNILLTSKSGKNIEVGIPPDRLTSLPIGALPSGQGLVILYEHWGKNPGIGIIPFHTTASLAPELQNMKINMWILGSTMPFGENTCGFMQNIATNEVLGVCFEIKNGTVVADIKPLEPGKIYQIVRKEHRYIITDKLRYPFILCPPGGESCVIYQSPSEAFEFPTPIDIPESPVVNAITVPSK